MPPRKKNNEEKIEINEDLESLISSLRKDINKESETKISFDLEGEDSPTKVSRYIDSGSKLLNFAISGDIKKGYPEGRVLDLHGDYGLGKTHLAIQLAKSVQKSGGIVVYCDVENAISIENLKTLGVNLKKLVYVQPTYTEQVFEVAEKTIAKSRALNKDIPILWIWDSVTSSSPKAELENTYESNQMGLQARVLSKGFRKITQTIGHNKITFLCLSQIRQNIGVMFGDNITVPGGKALPFASSIRVRLSSGSKVKDKDENVIGINVVATIIKNKISNPFRKCEFQIHFGSGIKEDEEILAVLEKAGEIEVDGNKYEFKTAGPVKHFIENGEIRSFKKSAWNSLMTEKQELIDKILQKALCSKFNLNIDPLSLEDVQEIQRLQNEME